MEELKTLELVDMPAYTVADVLRKNIALEAKNDSSWVLYYENILEKNRTNIENTPLVIKENKLAYTIANNRKSSHENKKRINAKKLAVAPLLLSVLLLVAYYVNPSLIIPVGLSSLVGIVVFSRNINKFLRKSPKHVTDLPNLHYASKNYSETSWGVSSGNIDKASLCFQVRANEILETYNTANYCYSPTLTTFDKINIIVAGELWILANNAKDFEQAASLGPGAVGSYANILARSIGSPCVKMPLLDADEFKKDYIMETDILDKIDSLKTWATTHISDSEWNSVIDNIVTDFTTSSPVESRVNKFARHLKDF